jgi:MFS family permease
MLKHPLVRMLMQLRGNPRACVYTEPLWGIPYNLYAPYVSVYMLTLGMKDVQIGLIASIGLACQIVGAIFGGPLTDKLGRRKATLIFDIVAWSVPTFIWAIAQDFRFFVAAAIFNGAWRVTHTSWSCLMVEDADPEHLVDIYSWVYISGLLAAFFAPIAGLLINAFTLVPTVRGLFAFACVMMTIKFYTLWVYSTETQQGAIRLEETKHQSMFSLVSGYGGVFKQVLRTPQTLFTLGILIAMSASNTISTTFWSIIVTQRIKIPNQDLALYPFARSIVMLIFFFVAMQKIKEMKFRNPMIVGFLGLAVAQIILVLLPEKSYVLLLVSTFIEACSYATVSTQVDRMLVVTVDAQERARIMGLLFLIVLVITTPMGYIAGELSAINRVLPFLVNIGLFGAGALLVFLAARHKSADDQEPAAVEPAVAG